MIRAIEDGLYQPSMKARMTELEAEKTALEARLAAAPELPKVRLHPNLAGMYRQKVAALEQALADPEIKAEAAEIVRSQIEQITLTPSAGAASTSTCTATWRASWAYAARAGVVAGLMRRRWRK
jgi:site-specific DNA recombinase